MTQDLFMIIYKIVIGYWKSQLCFLEDDWGLRSYIEEKKKSYQAKFEKLGAPGVPNE